MDETNTTSATSFTGSVDESYLIDALPEAASAPWCSDPNALQYVLNLAATPASQLDDSPQQLEHERARILDETQKLAFDNYKTFIKTAHCTTDVFKDFTTIQTSTNDLLTKLPDFADSCKSFLEKAEEINIARKKNSNTLQYHQRVLEILEIPQLMDTCVRNSYYEEALQLQAHVGRLNKRYSDISIINSISEDVQRHAEQMQSNLVSQLCSDVQLPACLRIVGYLRRLHVFSELELRIQFLKARDSWLQKVLSAVPTKDPYNFITKTVETSRVHLFDIITQYKAVFSHPIERDSDDSSSEGLLSGWILQRVTDFLENLGEHLPRLVDRFNTVLGQCMHFALSLGRVGLDFRALLPPLFERAILDLISSRIEVATADFIQDMPTMALLAHPTIVDNESSDGLANAPIAPLSLMAHPILAKLTNSYITALNDLRECAPLEIGHDVGECMAKSVLNISISLQGFYETHLNTMDQKEINIFKGLCKLFIETLVPCLVRCVDAIYPASVFQSGSALVPSQGSPSSRIDQVKLAGPLKSFCTEAHAIVIAASVDADDLLKMLPKSPSTKTPTKETSPAPVESSVESSDPAEEAAREKSTIEETNSEDKAENEDVSTTSKDQPKSD